MNKLSEYIDKALDFTYEQWERVCDWYERDVQDNPTCKILLGFTIGSILMHIFL